MWDNLGFALALVLIAEGLLPFLSPRLWRSTFERMIALENGQLRFIGFISLLAGVLLLLVF
ncbi:DUF2065 domain-containing protein [Chitinimonas sp. BJB300]|uniref:DUF2065 domain-containing protein n=1 Tax=Chitinimonas sp. BJB300 TaxID=1559339 RepID=UPI000C11583C|nr:DUF2065 domain-containing protein [Chitinimonas sp. BJB300]PHV13029.1 DUF2065 domain-containing protein [Chitinimonas sp. BJB300]TSJ89153.1 DUF2065 domain-containing protein [Chitinimonas sp. BJB300]